MSMREIPPGYHRRPLWFRRAVTPPLLLLTLLMATIAIIPMAVYGGLCSTVAIAYRGGKDIYGTIWNCAADTWEA